MLTVIIQCMKVTPIKTEVVHIGDDLKKVISSALPSIPEKSVLVVTCKVIALAEGAVAERRTGEKEEKWQVVRQEAELYTEPHSSQYNMMLSIKDQIMAVNAGIDESNSDGQYVLFPKDPYLSARQIWQWLRSTYKVEHVGVLVIDSRTFPLKWGTIGTALAHCGFKALNNRIGEKDLFGHEMQMTQENMAEGLAVAANVVMGEVAECQPLAVLEDLPMIQFQDNPPTKEEIAELHIDIADDVYAPILLKADWKKGGSYRS